MRKRIKPGWVTRGKLACAVALLPALRYFGTLTEAAELHVGSGYPYSTITGAVAAATHGDIVTIHSGVYTSAQINITLTNLVLRGAPGEPRPKIVSTSGQYANMIVINADGIQVRGLEITHQSGSQYGYGIGDGNGALARSGWTVEDCVIYNCRSAVWNTKRSRFSFINNVVYSNYSKRLYLQATDSFVCMSNFFREATRVSGQAIIEWQLGNDPNATGDTLIAYNYFHGGRSQVLIIGSGSNSPSGNRTITIAHNTFDGKQGAWGRSDDYASQLVAFWDNTGATYDAAKIIVRDNLFVESLWYAIYNGEAATRGFTGDLVISNCLFHRNYSYDPWYPGYAYPEEWPEPRGQAGWTTNGGDMVFPNSSVADPLFVRAGTTPAEYYALQPDSPARDAASDGGHIGAWQGGHRIRTEWTGAGSVSPVNPSNLAHRETIGFQIAASTEDHHISGITFQGQNLYTNSGNRGLMATNLLWIVERSGTLTVTFAPSKTTNGVLLSWLTEYGITNKSDSVEDEDPDGDGFTVLQEFIADTHPTNGASYLPPLRSEHGNPSVRVIVDVTSSRRRYHLLRTTSLAAPIAWQEVTNALGTDGPWINLRAYPEEAEYYRCRVTVP